MSYTNGWIDGWMDGWKRKTASIWATAAFSFVLSRSDDMMLAGDSYPREYRNGYKHL